MQEKSREVDQEPKLSSALNPGSPRSPEPLRPKALSFPEPPRYLPERVLEPLQALYSHIVGTWGVRVHPTLVAQPEASPTAGRDGRCFAPPGGRQRQGCLRLLRS